MCTDVLTVLFDSGAAEGSSFLACLPGTVLRTCPAYASGPLHSCEVLSQSPFTDKAKCCHSHGLQTKPDSIGETAWGRCAGVPVIACLFSGLFHRNPAVFYTHDVDPRHPRLEQWLAPYSRMFHPWAKQTFIAVPGTVSSV